MSTMRGPSDRCSGGGGGDTWEPESLAGAFPSSEAVPSAAVEAVGEAGAANAWRRNDFAHEKEPTTFVDIISMTVCGSVRSRMPSLQTAAQHTRMDNGSGDDAAIWLRGGAVTKER